LLHFLFIQVNFERVETFWGGLLLLARGFVLIIFVDALLKAELRVAECRPHLLLWAGQVRHAVERELDVGALLGLRLYVAPQALLVALSLRYVDVTKLDHLLRTSLSGVDLIGVALTPHAHVELARLAMLHRLYLR